MSMQSVEIDVVLKLGDKLQWFHLHRKSGTGISEIFFFFSVVVIFFSVVVMFTSQLSLLNFHLQFSTFTSQLSSSVFNFHFSTFSFQLSSSAFIFSFQL
jgi:hypothetical protein